MIATDLDRSLAYTALLNLDPAYARLDMKDGGVYVTALVEAWLAQNTEKNLWEFARNYLRPRTRCATIGCEYSAIVTLTWSMPGSRDKKELDYVCRECAAGYARRPALNATIGEGGRPWHNMSF